MVDISNIVNMDQIRENKDRLREQRVKSAQLSGWEEMSRYIEDFEISLAEMNCSNAQDIEFFNGQAAAIEMFKSFISNRVKTISPEHSLAMVNNMAIATM